MSKLLLLESLLDETRLAVVEDGQLCEYYVERPGTDEVTGSIYLGRVENLLPGMNAAFVDIGLKRNGFLSAGDISITDQSLSNQLKDRRIESLARPGQELLVQISKAQSGQKGHRLSCHIALPGRLMVLLTDLSYVGVSRKISNAPERDRLHAAAREIAGERGLGVIVRTAAEGASMADLAREWEGLTAQWAQIQLRARHAVAPKRVYSNASLALRCARDLLDPSVDGVWVDGRGLYDELIDQPFLSQESRAKIRLHQGDTPLFDLHRVDRALDQALRKYVWLPSGGSLIIQETEAMTVIDVNTGKFTGKRDLEETIFRLNCEAAEEVVRQLRLRDIGGIVIVDFIDMKSPENNEALLKRLRSLAKTDRNRLTVVGMTGLGLVELTRKRERRPLSKQLLHTCNHCGGDGTVPAYETTARRILHDIWRRRRSGDSAPLQITAAPEVAGWLKALGNPAKAPLTILPDPKMAPMEFRVEVEG